MSKTVSTEVVYNKYYNEGKSQEQIAKEIGVSQWKISKVMRDANMKTKSRTRHIGKRKYTLNESSLDVLDPKTAWVLGWMLSDGNVHKTENTFLIKVSPKDIDILYKLRDFFGYSGPILNCTTTLKNGRRYKGVLLKITSRILRDKLIQFGIIPAKSSREVYLTDIAGIELDRQFIKGVFEGDGSLLRYKRSTVFQIVGTKELLSEIQTRLMLYLCLKRTKLFRHKKSKNHYMLRYTGANQVRKIARWIYLNSEWHLDRKHMICKQMES